VAYRSAYLECLTSAHCCPQVSFSARLTAYTLATFTASLATSYAANMKAVLAYGGANCDVTVLDTRAGSVIVDTKARALTLEGAPTLEGLRRAERAPLGARAASTGKAPLSWVGLYNSGVCTERRTQACTAGCARGAQTGPRPHAGRVPCSARTRRPPHKHPAPLAGQKIAGSARVRGAARTLRPPLTSERTMRAPRCRARLIRHARRAQVVFIDGSTADANIFASMLQGPQATVFFLPAAGFDTAYNMGVSVRPAPLCHARLARRVRGSREAAPGRPHLGGAVTCKCCMRVAWGRCWRMCSVAGRE